MEVQFAMTEAVFVYISLTQGPDRRDTGHLMTCMRGDWMTDAHGGTLRKQAHRRQCQSTAQISAQAISRVGDPSSLLQQNFSSTGALIEVPAD